MSHFTNEKYEKYDRTENKKKFTKRGKKKKKVSLNNFFPSGTLRHLAERALRLHVSYCHACPTLQQQPRDLVNCELGQPWICVWVQASTPVHDKAVVKGHKVSLLFVRYLIIIQHIWGKTFFYFFFFLQSSSLDL